MMMNDFEKYDIEINNEKIIYFRDIWDEICENINKPNLDFDITTPHYLCFEILDEFNNNSLKNKPNRQYYLDRLNNYYSNDNTITGELKNYFSILRRELQEPRDVIVKQIINNILEYFNKGIYFNILLEKLSIILFTTDVFENIHKYNIKLLSKYIIVEYIFKGYHYKTIQNFINNILNGYYIYNDGIIITDYPHDINYEEHEKKYFYELLKNYIESLSLENRIIKLKDYYYAKKKDYYFIFHISGISGKKEITVNNVTFYNPKIRRYISKTYHTDIELMKNNENDEMMNVIVLENCIDKEYGKILAKNDVSKVFDILKYVKFSKAPFIIDNRKCIILDKNFDEEGYHTRRAQDYTYYDFLRIDENFEYTNKNMENISKFISRNETIEDALYYYRKANEVSRYEEKLINYWITLETLFTNINLWNIIPNNNKKYKIELILEIVPRILICHYIYKYGWDIFYKLDLLLKCNNINKEILNTSDDVLEDAGLYPYFNNEKHIVYLYKFLDKLNLFISLIKDEILKDDLISINELYFNSKKAIERINKLYIEIKNEILLLYKIRNKIVHNAFYQSQFMEYSVNKLEFIVDILLDHVIDKNGNKSFDEKMIEYYIEFEEIKNHLDKDGKYTLYQYVKNRTIEKREK